MIILKGGASPRIKKEIQKLSFPDSNILEAGSMKEAVKKAKKESQYMDVVLLSTACASFGLFKNYKQRGELFKKEVE